MDRRTVAGTFCASMLGSGFTALVAWDTVPTSTIHDALAWFGVAAVGVGSGGLGYLLITGPKPAPRHRDGIYQYGERVGGVGGISDRADEGFINLNYITATQDFDQQAPFEYQSYVLELAGWLCFTRLPTGAGGRYDDAKCRILKRI